jgi:hypothetical protein
MSAPSELSAQRIETRYEMAEEFSDFEKRAWTPLSHTYKLEKKGVTSPSNALRRSTETNA